MIMLGFALNAAVPPLHAWLTDAYPEGTVTGSVFMTAFTTKTGVYVLARAFPGAEVLMWAGAIMAVYGVFFAFIVSDIRRLLAYHIVSQVGYMVCGVGIGTAMALNGSASHAFCHILYKALLFMGAGAVLHVTAKSKFTELGGLAKYMPWTFVFYMVGAFSISGVPLFNGFISKSMIIAGAALEHQPVIETPQTFGNVLNPHPHTHCLASRGLWDEKGQWLPVPYIDTVAAEKLFAHKILHLLKTKGLLSDKRLELLDSFRHSGFSVDASPTVWPQDALGLERLCRYLLRCPVCLSRVHWTPGSKTLFYESKSSHDDPLFSHPQGETLDVFEFIARVLTQIPEPRAHGVRYFGAYSSKARAYRNRRSLALESFGTHPTSRAKDELELSPKKRAALRKNWARLIKRVYQAEPLKCDCGGSFRVIAFIKRNE